MSPKKQPKRRIEDDFRIIIEESDNRRRPWAWRVEVFCPLPEDDSRGFWRYCYSLTTIGHDCGEEKTYKDAERAARRAAADHITERSTEARRRAERTVIEL